MSTITISLPQQIAKKIDTETRKMGFATRSEFIRNLLRKYFTQEELKLEAFVPKSLEEMEKGLYQTGKYNQKFVKSVIRGLKDSSFYEGKTS